MIAYSPDAEPARAYLLKAYNDLDVFVEDATCQNMYVRLINRMLSGRGRISQVFPLHGRANVLAQCRTDQLPRARKRIYVIDADQDLILGKAAPPLKYLYRLNVYSSENLLLSEHAIITLATESKTNESWAQLAIDLQIRPMLDQAIRLLMPLFVIYGVVAKLGLGIETVGFSVHRLLRDRSDPTTLSEELIRARIIRLLREIRQQSTPRKYRSARRAILRELEKRRRHASAYISGKTYLLPLIQLQLRRVAGVNDSMDGIKVRLAQHCELNIDARLRAALMRATK